MKSSLSSVRDRLIEKYTIQDRKSDNTKSTDINVLLNRVKLDKKKESRKKILFSAVTSIGLVLFGVLIF